jgi:DNA-binding NarL/FixJ family response regulator
MSDGGVAPCDHHGMGRRVLIVDDHPSFRRFARRLLQAGGFDVVGEAEDGTSAVAAAQRLHPELVLLDVLLPDMSGFSVAQALAEHPDGPQVVLVSSRSESELGPALAASPARGFVPKSELTAAAVTALLEGAA